MAREFLGLAPLTQPNLRAHVVVLVCFFSSRRRHTRLQGDWSSDVCSSDLGAHVYRLPVPSRRGGRAAYVARYAAFFVGAAVAVSVLHLRRRYRLVQVHSLPDEIGRASCRERGWGSARAGGEQ